MHLGKNLLECLIHPWQSSGLVSSHPARMASKRDIWSCGWWPNTFHLQAEKNSSIGLRKGEYAGRYKTINLWCAANQSVTAAEWWKETIIGQCSTHGDISPPLAWNLHSGPLTYNIPSSAPCFGKVKSSFIDKYKWMWSFQCFHLHYSLKNSKCTVLL